jgi:hypothetical protein
LKSGGCIVTFNLITKTMTLYYRLCAVVVASCIQVLQQLEIHAH